MKTKELLDKYRIIISSILNCKPEEIKFFVSGRGDTPESRSIRDEISSLDYKKNFNWSLGNYTVFKGEELIASFVLYELHHCCAFMVSCKAEVMPRFRNKKIGTTLNQLRQDIGRVLGYSAILCTDIEQNTHQRQLLKTNGWKDIHSLVNKRTNNRVYLTVINI